MLQINSSKLFTNKVEYTNHLRGVLYTNLRLYGEKPIDTAAGKLVPTSNIRDSSALIYEIKEQVEYRGQGAGILVSHGIDPYIMDFSTVVSFVLNCICTPDYDLAIRLTSGKQGLATHNSANQLVNRTFDNKITFKEDDEEQLVSFTKHLIGLERKYFLGVMRAIRTYVTGVHRIADDLELAYTLLVASIESLAQDFDGYESTWEDYPSSKRKIIDNTLKDADKDTSTKVRNALLSIEHTSLSRRYREFVINHIKPSYFREEAINVLNPIGKHDLIAALSQSYTARSRYIHNLKKLPANLTFGHTFSETVTVDGKTWLTLQGLTRLAKHVIMEFVKKQPSIEKESYDYRLERSGIVQAPLAPQYWIHNTKNLKSSSGVSRLQGFLDQLSQIVQGNDTKLTDIREVLRTIEPLLPSMKSEEKYPFIALHIIFNNYINENDRMDSSNSIRQKYGNELSKASSEYLVTYLLLGIKPELELSAHHDAIINYFKTRDRKYELRAPKLFEVGMILELSERYRQKGDDQNVRELISMAVENYSGNSKLLDFESTYKEENVIAWKDIFLSE